jgi:hypothetical protein
MHDRLHDVAVMPLGDGAVVYEASGYGAPPSGGEIAEDLVRARHDRGEVEHGAPRGRSGIE